MQSFSACKVTNKKIKNQENLGFFPIDNINKEYYLQMLFTQHLADAILEVFARLVAHHTLIDDAETKLMAISCHAVTCQ